MSVELETETPSELSEIRSFDQNIFTISISLIYLGRGVKVGFGRKERVHYLVYSISATSAHL
jgi:hypothetical protein